MKPPYWRVIFFDRDDSDYANWYPSHQDFDTENEANQFAADTTARVGEAEVHRIGGAA